MFARCWLATVEFVNDVYELRRYVGRPLDGPLVTGVGVHRAWADIMSLGFD